MGGFILTVNDTPAMREVFSGFAMEPAELMYGVGGEGRTKAVQELISTGPREACEVASTAL